MRSRKTFDPHFIPDERRRSYRLALILFWSVLLYFFFQHYVISVGILKERSMLPSMKDGDYFLVNKYLYRFRSPKRGEVVVLRTFANAPDQYVKRVIAIPGDTLAIRDGKTWLNGRPLDEPTAVGPTLPNQSPMIIKESTYFVMGDNRSESIDSRTFQSVHRRDILGKIDPEKFFPFN